MTTARGWRERLRRWWWLRWNDTERAIYRRPHEGDGPMWRRYVVVRQRQRREPFGDWVNVGFAEGFHSVEWYQTRWDRLEDQGYVVE